MAASKATNGAGWPPGLKPVLRCFSLLKQGASTEPTEKGRATSRNRREVLRPISQAQLTVDLGALSCVPALRAKPKARDTPVDFITTSAP